ncbi:MULTISPECIES: mycofactocin-coupled SDR family oxidoreductase [unclassified Geodermatophilus]
MSTASAPGRVAGTVALVTGAARGQGRAHCLRLAEEGADVVAVDLCAPVPGTDYPPATEADLEETAEAVRAAGRRAAARVADVRDDAALRSAVDGAVAELGRLDVVVANAGVVVAAPAEQLSAQEWRTVVDTNLTGVWNTVSAALPHLLARPAGSPSASIVVTSSANGGMKAPPHLAAYAASKFGVVGLVRSLAHELGPRGVRVNAVHPTAVSTPMIHNEATYRLFAPEAERPGPAEVAPVFARFHSLPVPWIEPVDVSNAVLWLASDEARYVTGVSLPVDAGLSAR